MKNTLLTFALVSLHFTSSYAQDEDWRLYKSKDSTSAVVVGESNRAGQLGAVHVHADERILRIDSLKRIKPTLYDGYRVQIFFGGRNEAQDARVEFLRKYPDMGAYITYLAPNFRLRVGDFRSRIEGEKFKEQITREYQGSYIVKDHIEMPKLRQGE